MIWAEYATDLHHLKTKWENKKMGTYYLPVKIICVIPFLNDSNNVKFATDLCTCSKKKIMQITLLKAYEKILTVCKNVLLNMLLSTFWNASNQLDTVPNAPITTLNCIQKNEWLTYWKVYIITHFSPRYGVNAITIHFDTLGKNFIIFPFKFIYNTLLSINAFK